MLFRLLVAFFFIYSIQRVKKKKKKIERRSTKITSIKMVCDFMIDGMYKRDSSNCVLTLILC